MLLKFVFMVPHYQSAETEADYGVVCVPSEEAVSLGSSTNFSVLPGVVHGAQRSPRWEKWPHCGYLHIFNAPDPSLPCLLGECKTKSLYHLPVYH